MHTLLPFLQRPFFVSSWHPLLMLKAQHIGLLLSSNCLYPFSSSGHFALALDEALAFFFGCKFRVGGALFAPSSTDDAAVVRPAAWGKGKRCILILGSVVSLDIRRSNGSSPFGPFKKGPLCSCAITVNSSLSARKICSMLTLAYPLGASLVSCMRSMFTQRSWMSFEINLHWSKASPRLCNAHCIKSSFDVSAFNFGLAVLSFNVCCSNVNVVGFSFKVCCTSASLFVHLLGGTHMIDPLSKIPAMMSTNAYDGCSSPLMLMPRSRACWSFNLATFSTGGSFLPPSVLASVTTLVFRCATTIVTASKCSLLRRDINVKDGSTPPLSSVAKALKASSVAGTCGVPIAKAILMKVVSSAAMQRLRNSWLLSMASQWLANAASESTSAIAPVLTELPMTPSGTQTSNATVSQSYAWSCQVLVYLPLLWMSTQLKSKIENWK